jgi:hypothetical protein
MNLSECSSLSFCKELLRFQPHWQPVPIELTTHYAHQNDIDIVNKITDMQQQICLKMGDYTEDSTSLQFLTKPADDSIIPTYNLNNKQDIAKRSVMQFFKKEQLYIYLQLNDWKACD